MSEELKPCPFCGSEPRRRLIWDESVYSHASVEYLQIVCDECEATSMSREEHDDVVAAWNRRATHEAQSLPELPQEAAGYMRGCNWDIQDGELLFTADQMLAYGRKCRGET